MAKREFAPAFRTFVNKNITSVEQIEVLLILHANPDRVWNVAEITFVETLQEVLLLSLYIVRLITFLLIIVAIVDKNRSAVHR